MIYKTPSRRFMAEWEALDREDAERRAHEAEARANSPVTRQELRDAIEAVAHRFAPHSDLIRDAFRALIEELA